MNDESCTFDAVATIFFNLLTFQIALAFQTNCGIIDLSIQG